MFGIQITKLRKILLRSCTAQQLQSCAGITKFRSYDISALNRYNFTNSTINNLINYLTNVHQFIQIDDKSSKKLPVCF